MSFKSGMPTVRMIYDGIFDWDNFYREMRNWFVDREFELSETTYKHKVPSPAGSEDQIKWEAFRKIDGMVKYKMTVKYHLLEMKYVDVVVDGQNKKMLKAKLKCEFTGAVEVDYKSRWGGSHMLDLLKKWFFTYVYKTNIQNVHEDELYYTIYKLQYHAKALLDSDTKYYRSQGRF